MSKKVIVFMAKGFEEMELTISVDILRRADIDVKIAGLANKIGPITGSRGMKMIPDMLVSEVNTDNIDMIVIPGGLEGTQNLAESEAVLSIVRKMNDKKGLIAAICAGPVVLIKAGVMKGRTATSHPAAKDYMQQVTYLEDRVVVDDNIITSRAAGTTFEFAFKLMQHLVGAAPVSEVNKGVLAKL